MAERYEEAASLIRKAKRVRIISHHDADGILSAGVESIALRRLGIGFHITLVRGLDEDIITRLNQEANETTIMCDLGSGDIESLENVNTRLIVLDHHQIQGEAKRTLQINPHLEGLNGGDVLCGSMLSFLFALSLDEKNWDLLFLALSGAIADKQHLGGFKGPNAKILEAAIERGIVEKRKGLFLEGEVKHAMTNSTDPYLGFDNSGSVESLLGKLGIEPSARIEDLDKDSMRSLTSMLALRLLSKGARPEAVENLSGDIYWFTEVKRSANSMAEDLNACGRTREEMTGLKLCFRDPDSVQKAKELRSEYEKKIMAGIQDFKAESGFKKDHIQFFYCSEPRIAGALAGIRMQYFPDQERAAFALTVLRDRTKVSCRGTKHLVRKGLDLATACREAAATVNGRGGGHSIASGALIPKGKEEKFLVHADKTIGMQYSSTES
jgi:single-stranded DNA-specific DHH superfamily exonuclease